MNKNLLTLFAALFCATSCCNSGNDQLTVTPLEESKLTDNGLYFEGERNVDYRFGKQITPHGDCVDYADGYVFVTWYEGGMENRHLRLSRKKVGSDKWVTIEFPDQHTGLYGDAKIGDSHNTAAVGICPIDNTIHLVYDIHSYFPNFMDGDYFRYRVSVKNATTVPDEEWNLSLFEDKRNYLNEKVMYARSTYPEFDRLADNRLMFKIRFGGSGKGNNTCHIYDGKEWSADYMEFNRGKEQPEIDLYSIYGGFKYLHGRFYAGYAIRYFNRKNRPEKYGNNNGLFYAYTDDPDLKEGWKTLDGRDFEIPVEQPDVMKIAEPCPDGKNMSQGVIWTVTENDAKHFITNVAGERTHYYTAPGSSELMQAPCEPVSGEMFSLGDKILVAGLEAGVPVVKCAKEGTNEWSEIYRQEGGRKYRHGRVELFDNLLFMYLMEEGEGHSQPIHLLTFNIE